jgi:predicted AAA+ superfamily ATPase
MLSIRTTAAPGPIFESYVLSELLKNAYHHGREPDLYFWRDSTGHEIDLLLERGGDLVATEVKSAQTIAEDFFDNLAFWRDLVGDPAAPAALVHGGRGSFRRKGLMTYGWSTL